MLSDSKPRHLPGKLPWLVVLILLGPLDCLLVLVYLPSLADSLESWVFADPIHPPKFRSQRSGNVDLDVPGIDQPPTLSADKAGLEDDILVIGVYVSGHARAYLLEALKHGPESHIVNDLLGEVPISVTHCDISGCTRVFTGNTPGRTLELSVGGGRKNGGMLLKHKDQVFYQQTGEPLLGKSRFPFREYPVEVMEWGAWRKAHPDTDVYIGLVEEAMPTTATSENAG